MKRTALVCDDREEQFDIVAEVLGDAGFEAKHVKNGTEAKMELERVRRDAKYFDVVMIDFDLSMNGQNETGEGVYLDLEREFGQEDYIIYTTTDADHMREAINRLSTKDVSFSLLDYKSMKFQLFLCLPKQDHDTVFLVCGRNADKNGRITEILKKGLGLKVVTFEEARRKVKSPRKYIYEIVMAGIDSTYCSLVLFTDDEEVALREEFLQSADYDNTAWENAPVRRQSRGNVLIEAGYAFGRRPWRTIFVQWTDDDSYFDLPSDFAGAHYLDYDDSKDARENLMNRLLDCHCQMKPKKGWVSKDYGTNTP
jgi:CheY-like chemotaxis protein/predicted nucleotide-binding protein